MIVCRIFIHLTIYAYILPLFQMCARIVLKRIRVSIYMPVQLQLLGGPFPIRNQGSDLRLKTLQFSSQFKQLADYMFCIGRTKNIEYARHHAR